MAVIESTPLIINAEDQQITEVASAINKHFDFLGHHPYVSAIEKAREELTDNIEHPVWSIDVGDPHTLYGLACRLAELRDPRNQMAKEQRG